MKLLIDHITLSVGIYSLNPTEQELISQCRVVLHWAYEFKNLPRKSLKSKKGDLVESIFQFSTNFIEKIRAFMIQSRMAQSRWEWALFRDLLQPQPFSREFSIQEFDLNSLTNIDKGLISKLLVLTITNFTSPPVGEIRTSVCQILSKFIPSPNTLFLEYSSKLLSLSIQTILNREQEILDDFLFLDIIPLVFKFLDESLVTPIPLVDYQLKICPVLLPKIAPLVETSPSRLIACHSRIIDELASLISTSIQLFSSSTSHLNPDRLELFYVTFPLIWTQCLKLWSCNPQAMSIFTSHLMPKSNHLFDLIFENLPVDQQQHVPSQFSQLFLSPIKISPSELSHINKGCVSNSFTERWLSQITFHLETDFEETWTKSMDWESFYQQCREQIITTSISIATFLPPSEENFDLFRLLLLSQVCWKFWNKCKSKECPVQRQQIGDEIQNQLLDLRSPSKKGKKGKGRGRPAPIHRFRCIMLQLHWKLSRSVEVRIEENPSEVVNELDDILKAFESYREIRLDSLMPCDSFDFLENTHLLFHILGLTGNYILQVELLKVIVNFCQDDSLSVSRRMGFCQVAGRLKALFLSWCAFNGCFEEFYRVIDDIGTDYPDELISSIMGWLSDAVVFLNYIFESRADVPDLTLFRDSTDNLFRRCRSSRLYLHASWIALLYGKIQIFLTDCLSEALIWTKNVLSLRETGSHRFGISVDTLEIGVEAMLQMSDIYESIGAVEKCLSYLAEARILSSTEFGTLTYLPKLFSLHGLRIWKRTGSSRFHSEVEKLSLKPLIPHSTHNILHKIAHTAEIIRNLFTFDSKTQTIQDNFRYRYMNILWGLSTRSENQPSEMLPISPVGRSLCLEFGLPHTSDNHLFSGFSTITDDDFVNIFSTSKLLRTEYFDIQKQARRRVALDILLNTFDHQTSSSTRHSHPSSLQSFLTWFAAASSCQPSIENILKNRSETETPHLRMALLRIKNIFAGEISILQETKCQLHRLCDDRSRLIICNLVFDHSNRRIMLSRFDHLHSFTISLGSHIYASLMQLMEEWDHLMSSNKTQLAETSDIDKVQSWKPADKKRWWIERENLDMQIQRILQSVENVFGVWKCLLISTCNIEIPQVIYDSVKRWVVESTSSHKKGSKGVNLDRLEDIVQGLFSWLRLVLSEGALIDECDQITATNELMTWSLSLLKAQLPSDLILQQSIRLVKEVNNNRVNALSEANLRSPQPDSLDELTNRLASLKVVDLKSELKSHGLEVTGKKGELHDRLFAHLQSSHIKQPQIPTTGSENHLILLLDETFQSLPMECLPALRSKSCSRVPSLVLLLQLLNDLPDHSPRETKFPAKQKSKIKQEDTSSRPSEKLSSKIISISNCWYSIDPEANLVNTRETIMPFMQTYISKWNWKGFSGQMPPDEIVR